MTLLNLISLSISSICFLGLTRKILKIDLERKNRKLREDLDLLKKGKKMKIEEQTTLEDFIEEDPDRELWESGAYQDEEDEEE